MINSLRVESRQCDYKDEDKIIEAMKIYKIEKFFDIYNSYFWGSTDSYFRHFTEVAIFDRSSISFASYKNLRTLEVSMRFQNSFYQLIEVLRSSMSDYQLNNLTLRINQILSNTLKEVNNISIINLTGKRQYQPSLLIKKLEIDTGSMNFIKKDGELIKEAYNFITS